jgi:hypothetical protein
VQVVNAITVTDHAREWILFLPSEAIFLAKRSSLSLSTPGSRLPEDFCNFGAARALGFHEGRVAPVAFHIYIGPGSHEDTDNIRMAHHHSEHKGCKVILVVCVDICKCLDKNIHDIGMAFARGIHKRRIATSP